MPRPAPVTIATFLIVRALPSGIASLKTVVARMATAGWKRLQSQRNNGPRVFAMTGINFRLKHHRGDEIRPLGKFVTGYIFSIAEAIKLE
jgi:hypothetical protein